MQNEVVTHETSTSTGSSVFATVGMVSADQVVPFHISPVVAPVVSSKLPTARPKTEFTQETPESTLVEFGVAVVGIVDQFDALTCAGALSVWGVAACTALPSRRTSGSAAHATAIPAVRTLPVNRMTTSPNDTASLCAKSF